MADLNDLIFLFSRLPGIGKKSAARICYYLLKNKEYGLELTHFMQEIIKKIIRCSSCGNYTTTDPCSICTDSYRDSSIICVVEDTGDLQAIEASGHYTGHYHILDGTINPLEGVGTEQLRIAPLLKRLEKGSFEEILIATNPTVEGEATYLFLQNLLKDTGIKISRIATGIPMGGSLEYADKLTITKALQSKKYSNQ